LEVGSPNKANLSISVKENSRGHTFHINYKLNCSYSFYLAIIKNEKNIMQFSNLIAEAKIIESLKPNLTLNSLKFKRFGSLEPREFNYVKYQNGSKRQNWEILMHE
jgi:hypothetical protein